MKIIFLCGSLEPGRDGVGDYTRRLAGELICKGHEAGILSLNDRYIFHEFYGAQNSAGWDIRVLRLPHSLPFKHRIQRAQLWINEYNPEWLSLQFVPFAFHRKGLPFNIGGALINFGKRKWHIMFHELWVGMEINAPRKQNFYGFLQRRLIKSLIHKLQPAVIHTQARLYMAWLTKLGYHPQYLPLFGNIPISPAKEEDVSNMGQPFNKSKFRLFVLFGGIHSGAPINCFAKDVAQYCIKHKVQVLLKIIGRCGPEQNRWVSGWEAAGLPVEILGEQRPESISEELSSASLGIATTPFALIDKSGSVAAMLEHRLPILCVSKDWKPKGMNFEETLPGVREYKTGNSKKIFCFQKGKVHSNDISTIAQQFLNNLLLSV